MPDPRAGPPVFCIVDPSLRDFIGHHFSYDNAVARGAVAAGFRAVTLAHRAVTDAVAGGTAVVRCFRRDMWSGSELARPLPGRVRAAVDMLVANHDFHADLTAGLRGLALPPGSVLFAHMIFRNQLPALARFVWDQPAGGPLEVILLLRYQPDFYANPLCARAFRRLERAVAAGRRVRLASDSARLSHELGRLTSLPIEVMPIPHTTAAVPPPSRPPGAPLRLASLGNARDEKGYIEILDAIRLLRASGELKGLEFIVQSNDAAPDVQAAIDAFSADCPPNVTLLRQSLAPGDYSRQLMAADVVLVPYWREVYRARTSGVFLESVAAGKVIVATRDTWMSDELQQYGAGVLVDDHDPSAIVEAIRSVRNNLRSLAEQAELGRTACLARHNPAALVRQARDGAPADPAARRDVRRVAMFYPWGNFLDRTTGSALRCNLLVNRLSPLVEEIRVLQDGPWLGVMGQIVAGMRPDGPLAPVRNGNVQVELATLRTRQHVARRLFRLPFRFLLRRHFGQEMMLWFFLERRLDPAFAAKVREIVAWADVVLLEYPLWASIVAPACRAFGKPLVLTNHDVLAQQVTASRLLRKVTAWLEIRGLARADHVVCASSEDQAWFARAGIRARVIPNPVDQDRLAVPIPCDHRLMLRELYDIALPPGPVCLFVGSRFGANAAAAARIRDFAAHMAGTFGPVAFVIAGACTEPARGANWVSLGRVEDGALALLYRLAALVLVPLESGTGSSVKTAEALGAGKPVLGTSVAFRGLDLHPGKDCVLEDDLALWPARIAGLLNAPGQRAAIGAAARTIGEGLDFRRVFDDYLPLIGLPSVPMAATGSSRHAVPGDLMTRALARDRLDVAAMLLAGSNEADSMTQEAMARQVLAAALRGDRLQVALIAVRRLLALGSLPDRATLRDLVVRAADAGCHEMADQVLQWLEHRKPTDPKAEALHQLGQALERDEYGEARALLQRLARDHSGASASDFRH